MIRLRRYISPLIAQNAASFLNEHGIAAQTINALSAFGDLVGLEIVISNDSSREDAEKLLDEFDSSPVEVEEGWESAAMPDLSKLDPTEIDISCPSCSVQLPLDALLEQCPSCRSSVDIVALIAHRHGVEILEPCFEDPSVLRFATRAGRAVCESCGYNLRGLPLRGRCPECGGLYDIGTDKAGGPT